MPGVFSECDKACKGCNKRTRTADIYTHKQVAVVFGKLRKKYCRGYVAYKLAGKNGNKKSVFRKKSGEKFVHCVDPCKVSGKNEEAYEGC